MKEFKQATAILQLLKENGYEAYFVGGSVRDLLLGRSLGDIDIATSAMPADVMNLFPHHIPVGLVHGTVIVLESGIPYEVTTFRVEEGYDDFRHPKEVKFVRSLQEDLKRRDFTMNAIAMTEDGVLIDPYGGQKAIAEKRIVTVGNPHERFREDALRIMRGARFVSTLGFTLQEETKQAMIENMEHLSHIAIERIAVEFEKLLLGEFVTMAIPILIEVNMQRYLPGLEDKREKLACLTTYDWSKIDYDVEAWTLVLFTLEIENEINMLKNWKLPGKKMKRIHTMLIYLRTRMEKQWDEVMLYHAGEEIARMVEKLFRILSPQASFQDISSMLRALPIHNRAELAISGHDLLTWSKQQAGPWVANILDEVEKAVINKDITNTKDDIKEWLISCKLL
ncbi:CCA tRNA nucleotidyltransferase [Ectobacillus sp. sgz5001026]|uniref:CCA tRNA nucleotidyltransferase n=1 Tax=Ectobacillus sp. sgz5001026 TaxID=3242473 RepID=UPI0036D2CFB5